MKAIEEPRIVAASVQRIRAYLTCGVNRIVPANERRTGGRPGSQEIRSRALPLDGRRRADLARLGPLLLGRALEAPARAGRRLADLHRGADDADLRPGHLAPARGRPRRQTGDARLPGAAGAAADARDPDLPLRHRL